MNVKRLYVASSWRNQIYPEVVAALRRAGHNVYDFRNPQPGDHGFSWSQIDPAWKDWSPEQYRNALTHPIARDGFASDFGAMQWCDELCLVLPSGRSAHIEAGWAMGAGKRVSIFMPSKEEPELMYLTGKDTRICVDFGELLHFHGK